MCCRQSDHVQDGAVNSEVRSSCRRHNDRCSITKQSVSVLGLKAGDSSRDCKGSNVMIGI